jgi:8-oxo-dGTP pyrophosphatase MutT (NUDIX family)|tara:strand:- start:242 stop:898 length:657 start_codon:yes stop_codon:yes gene_type:complete
MTNMVFESHMFKRWKQRVESNGNVIKNIGVLGIISRDQVNLRGAFLDCRLLTPEGVEIPRCILIGGESAVIVPVLTCRQDGETYTLMVEQRRIVDGGYTEEFPAGTIGLETDDPKIIACQELEEELHMTVSPEELIPLNDNQVKINPCFSDGLVSFFYFESEVSLAFLEEMNGRSTGCHEDNEYIRVKVKKMSEVIKCMTPSALIGLKLVERALNRVF